MIGYRTHLRWRVTLAYTLLGGCLSLLFAAAAVYITEDYEEVLVDAILRGQAEDYSLRLSAHPDTPLPQTHRLSGYLRRADGSGEVPADFLKFGPGIHETDEDAHAPFFAFDFLDETADDGIHLGVFDTAQGRMYFVIDLSDIERLELRLSQFLAAVVLLGTGLSAWLGWLLSGATIAPVRKLAAAVDALPALPQRTQLAASLSLDELGRLAQAIDAYQGRLVDADEAERRFFADASHELRTPVAVVQGAVELLLDDPQDDPGVQRRLQRLGRGVRELTGLLEVLLGLVRRQTPEFAVISARSLLQTCADGVSADPEMRHLAVQLEATGDLRCPQKEALLILHAVIRRLLPPAPVGRLTLSADDDRIEIKFLAAAVTQGRSLADSGRSDRGLGLTLVGRLAEQLGWRIEEGLDTEAPPGVRIRLPAATSGVAGKG